MEKGVKQGVKDNALQLFLMVYKSFILSLQYFLFIWS